jgi:hypothetical protein
MAGRTPPPASASSWNGSPTKESSRTTSYPQGQEGKTPVTGALRTTSYKNSIQFDDRGYVTIN